MKVKVRHRSTRRKSSLSTWGIAGLVGLSLVLTFLLMQGGATASTPEVAASRSEVMLPVPVSAVAQGQALAEVEFVYIAWQEPQSATAYIDDVSGFRTHRTTRRLQAYMPIPHNALTMVADDINAVIERIPEGMRAITVNVDAESAVEGWAQSGSTVDVIVMRKTGASDNTIETQVIAENVKILSAGRSTKATAEMPQPPATVTLLVNQTDALRIKTAVHLGRIAFSLRGMGDSSPTTLTQMNQRALLGTTSLQIPKEAQFKGKATGPDGRQWVLSEGNRWLAKE